MEGLFSPSICFSRKENGALTSMRLLTGDSMAFGYDTLSRLKTRKIANQVLETYTYTPGTGSSTTTTLVAEKKNQVNGSTVHNFKYVFDARGNISKVTDSTANTSVAYTYDNQGQLLKAIHKKGTATQRTETYSYDTYGNIRSYSNGTNSHSYTYGDTNGWKDLLTKVDGHSLSYDGSGNPLSYYNGKSYTMAWSEGRNLASLTTDGKTATYTYDMNGLRTKKTNLDGTWVKYFVGDGKILGETLYGTDNVWVYDMRYTFDENGEVCGISLWNKGDTSWTKYYFVKNLQGDVLAVYQYGSSFTKVAEYTYDSWGNVLTATGTLANINPFRYRSYYRDNDSGFYYLQSRYFDPAIGRFINADSFASTGQDFLGYNMFAYCLNNPVNMRDESGDSAFLITLGIMAVGGLIGAVASACASIVTQDTFTGTVDTKSVLVAAASGFVAGAIAASPLGLLGQIVAGGIIGGASYYAECKVTGNSVQAIGMGTAIISGGISGWIGGAGANQGFKLTDLVKSGIKAIDRERKRANQKYALKMVEAISSRTKNAIAIAASAASIRYYMGTQFANVAAYSVPKIITQLSEEF